MRDGWGGDDDGVSLDCVNQLQGVGQAFCGAKGSADWLEGGRGRVGHPDHLDVGPFRQSAEMLLAEGAEASKQHAKRTGRCCRAGATRIRQFGCRLLEIRSCVLSPACYSRPQKGQTTSVEIAREGMMNSKAVSCVHAIAA